MPDSLGPALADLSYIAVAAVSFYGAYWAFVMRRALVGRIYRNHALWLGVLCILVFILNAGGLLPFPSANPFITALVYALEYAPWPGLVVFAFVDSTVPVARRSDPLLRSILHWEKVRIVLWSVLAFNLLLSIYLEITFPCLLPVPSAACISSVASNLGWFGLFWGEWGNTLVPFFVVTPGAAALLIGARRSRDPVLRESVKWLGVALLFVLGLFLVGVVEGILNLSNYYMTYSYAAVPWNAAFFLFGYALYRSTRSLAPLNRLPPIEPEMIPSATEATS